MPNYYVNDNAQPTGEHEVHKESCDHTRNIKSKTDLGWFATCQEAVKEAGKHYNNVDGCEDCIPECHTK